MFVFLQLPVVFDPTMEWFDGHLLAYRCVDMVLTFEVTGHNKVLYQVPGLTMHASISLFLLSGKVLKFKF